MPTTLDAPRTARRPAGPSGVLASPAAAPTDALRPLEEALHVLLAPLDYPDWQTWQVAVHGRLLALTGADTMCIHTPLAAGPAAWYSPHTSDEAMRGYVARVTADPTWDIVERRFAALGRAVAHEDALCSRAELEASPFFHEFLRPNRLYDLTVVGAGFGGDAPARLHFTNDARRDDDWRSHRGALLRAVLPAFQAGLGIWRQLGERRAELGRMLDALPDATLLYDAAGALQHANTGAARLLDGADALRAEAQRLAWSVGALARRAGGGLCGAAARGAAVQGGAHAERAVRAGARCYRLRGALAPSWLLGREPGVLVTIETVAARPLTDAELRERYGLTPRELEVARLVAEGLSNQELAARLGVSFFTARNHVERLLPKLGASNRARVGAILRGES